MVGLVLLSMAWFFFIGGAVMNLSVLRRRRGAKEGGPVASGIPLLPGVVGSLAAFLTLPALGHYGIDVHWPWLWIALPLFLDVSCGRLTFLFVTGKKGNDAAR